jgi:membrane associated rhomboid family serine protease
VRCSAHTGEPRKLVLSDPPGTPFDDVLEDEDEEPPPESGEPFPEHGGGKLAGLVMVGALVVAFLATGTREAAGHAFRAGSADAGRILHGEIWRAVTALTLHADTAHLVANATAGALLGTAVCRTLGGGLGAVLLVAAGAVGNLLNAVVRGPGHVSVGASTAVLGAVGLLSGLAFVRTHRAAERRRRAWVPLAAGLALLGMLGADPQTDLGAHLWGFVAGVALGAGAGLALSAPPGRAAQGVLAAATLAAVAGSWWLALRA